MLDHALVVYDFNLGMAETLLRDVAAERMTEQPAPGMNTPAWIVGHLALVNDQALEIAGRSRAGRREWEPLFVAGTPPTPGAAPFPGKDELLAELRAGHGRLKAAAAALDAAALCGPNVVPFEQARRAFPTVGDMLAFLLTGHYSMHLGQISAWRRAAGWAPLF